MRSKILSLFMLVVLLVSAACTPQATPTAPASPAVSPTKAPAQVTTAKTLTVLAAASLTESFNELGKLFETQNPGVKVLFSYAGSQQLAQQLDQGADADVFASASAKYMDAAVTSKRVNQGDAKTFIQNRLVLIFPKDNPGGLKTLKDLAKAGLKLDLADKAVPVGQYTLDFLDKAVKDASFDAQFKESVLKNVVSYENNVKAVVTKVSLGEADAGIVYVTDITADASAKIGRLDIPDALNTVATYPIAPISNSKNPDLAKAFVALVLSKDGQALLAKYGFLPATSAAQVTPAPAAADSFSVSDALGRSVTFQKAPQRIVLVGKAVIMIADAVYMFPEAGKRIVAIGSTTQGNINFIPMIDPAYKTKMILDSNAGVEQVAAAQPDCVIMKSSNAQTLGKALEAVKIPVVYLDFETPEQYQRDLKSLGQIFQNPARASQLAALYQAKVDAITKTVSDLKDDQKPRALILYYTEKDGAITFSVPPLGWMQTLQVTLGGGRPVWQDANPGSGWTKVSLEQVAAWKPDAIFVIAYTSPINDVVKKLKADPQWQGLGAVKNNQIYGFVTDVYSWDQPDARWILGLTWVAGKLHPDLFPNLDITKEAQALYKELYGMDEASFQKNIQPILTGDVR